MPKKKANVKLESLPPRERQVLDTIYKLSEGAVSEVLDAMENPPGYSAVRTMLNVLVQKGFLDYRREKTRYIYMPLLSEKKAQQSVFRNLLDTFFPGKPTAAVAALLDAAGELSEEDYREMEILVKGHRASGIGHRTSGIGHRTSGIGHRE